jgi:hypothetical protein
MGTQVTRIVAKEPYMISPIALEDCGVSFVAFWDFENLSQAYLPCMNRLCLRDTARGSQRPDARVEQNFNLQVKLVPSCNEARD